MRIAIGADHAGFPLKNLIKTELEKLGHTVLDCGAFQVDPQDDYPDFTYAVGLAIQHGDAARGIVVCGSGIGASVAANKMRGIRAAVCHDTYSARQGVEHDDLNVLCLGGKVIGEALALELVRAFVGASFTEELRHMRRLAKVKEIEEKSG